MPSSRPPAPQTIAAFLNLEHAHGQGILRGIVRAMANQPHIHLLRFSHTRLSDHAWLRSLAADGLIVKVTERAEATMLKRLGCPVIDTASECAVHSLVRVTTDNFAAGTMAAGYFLRRGYTSLAYVGLRGHGASVLRQAGFARANKEAGYATIHFEDELAAVKPSPRLAVRRRLQQWLDALPRPVGLFCFNDTLAAECARACLSLGLRTPADISLLGCNNDPIDVPSPEVEVSSIDLNTERIGYEAGRMMLGWLRGKAAPPLTTLLPPVKIVTRQSTDRFAVNDDAVLQALEFISERTAGTFTVNDVAQAAGISRRLLEMRFRAQLGYSIYEAVQRLRLERVVDLLNDPKLRLADIARAAGFSSAAKLSVAFLAKHGLAPSAFRKLHFGIGRTLRGTERARAV